MRELEELNRKKNVWADGRMQHLKQTVNPTDELIESDETWLTDQGPFGKLFS